MKATPAVTTYKAGEQVVYYLNDTEKGDSIHTVFSLSYGKFKRTVAQFSVQSFKYAFLYKYKTDEEAYFAPMGWKVVKIEYNANDGKNEVMLDVNNLPSWLTVSPLELPTNSSGKFARITVKVNIKDPTYPSVPKVLGNMAYMNFYLEQIGTGKMDWTRLTGMPPKAKTSN